MRMLMLIITLLAVTPATGQERRFWNKADEHPFGETRMNPPPRPQITGLAHNNTVDFLLCSGFHEGLASWHERAGDKVKAGIHRQLATDFHMDIGAQNSFGNRRDYAARTLAAGAVIREEMKTAINSKEWLDRYTKMFGEMCDRLEPAATEYRKH